MKLFTLAGLLIACRVYDISESIKSPPCLNDLPCFISLTQSHSTSSAATSWLRPWVTMAITMGTPLPSLINPQPLRIPVLTCIVAPSHHTLSVDPGSAPFSLWTWLASLENLGTPQRTSVWFGWLPVWWKVKRNQEEDLNIFRPPLPLCTAVIQQLEAL